MSGKSYFFVVLQSQSNTTVNAVLLKYGSFQIQLGLNNFIHCALVNLLLLIASEIVQCMQQSMHSQAIFAYHHISLNHFPSTFSFPNILEVYINNNKKFRIFCFFYIFFLFIFIFITPTPTPSKRIKVCLCIFFLSLDIFKLVLNMNKLVLIWTKFFLSATGFVLNLI